MNNKAETRKALAKVIKSYFKGKVYTYDKSELMRCEYRIKSVIPNKSSSEWVSEEFTLNLEVVKVEKSYPKKGEDGMYVRDESGRIVREFRKYSPNKLFAHHNNYKLRNDAKTPSIFKALGVGSYYIKIGTIKWPQ